MTGTTAGEAITTEIEPADSERRQLPLGRLPVVALSSGLGLLLCSVTDALSRAAQAPPTLLYWLGIAILVVPIFWRLSSRDAGTGERLALVCLLGLGMYAVKLAHDPLAFSFPDELLHSFNSNKIAVHHHLFHHNPILGISPYFPGVEGAASALRSMTGMSIYTAGIVLIGAARLTLVIALFLLFARISGSARIAGLGVGIYAANPNFLLFGAQFSYESLALPLLVLVLMALAEREEGPGALFRSWALPVALGTVAIVVTHHLTSYALSITLAVLALLYWFLRRRRKRPNPWPFAVLATVLSVLWLLVVATSTAGYLGPVLGDAFVNTVHLITGQSNPRGLFQSSPGVSTAAPGVGAIPILPKVIAVVSILILLAGLPFGLWEVWRRHRFEPFALLFCAGAVGFFATLGLRFSPAAWETGNRANEFVAIGLAFVIALAFVLGYARFEGDDPPFRPWLGRSLLTGALGLVLIGGAISGWPWDVQLADPLRADAKSTEISSEPLGMAQWAAANLPGRRFAATEADARMMLGVGAEWVRAGRSPDITSVLSTRTLENFEEPLLRRLRLRYVVTDRRRIGFDITRGYYFSTRSSSRARTALVPASTALKFEQIHGGAREYDSGNIAIYDIRGRSHLRHLP